MLLKIERLTKNEGVPLGLIMRSLMQGELKLVLRFCSNSELEWTEVKRIMKTKFISSFSENQLIRFIARCDLEIMFWSILIWLWTQLLCYALIRILTFFSGGPKRPKKIVRN